MRIRLAALVAGALVIAGCHSDSTAPDGRQAAADAAQTMLHLADSLSVSGGNASEVAAYRGLASLLTGTGRISTVTINVDGVASEYLATAQEIAWGCPQGMLCTMEKGPPIRSVVAWQKSNPRRMVQLLGSSVPVVGTFANDSIASPAMLQSLLFLDGAGAMYGGDATSQRIDATVSDTPCASASGIPVGPAAWQCRQAEFTAAFDGTVALIPLDGLYLRAGASPAASTSSAPTHRVTMTSQAVHGAHVDLVGLCVECRNPETRPPVTTPWRDSLTATLSATVGADVTFTFTVKNSSGQSATVRFNDGQQYDIRVWDAHDTLVWRWGADKAFTLALTTRTLAPGESWTYVEHWKPAAAGSYRTMAYLTSSSHGAVAFTNFSAP